MVVRELDSAPRITRPPRAMAWVLVLASAASVVIVGAVATALLFSDAGGWPPPPARFWPRFAAACALMAASLALRSLRWIFLLRRAEARIPIRDAYIGYLAGFSLLFAPLLIGESAVRAVINRRRGGIPVLTTLVVNAWERLLDVAALLAIALVAGWAMGTRGWLMSAVAIALLVLSAVRPLRLGCLRVALGVLGPLARLFDPPSPRDYRRLTAGSTWSVALAASVAAWVLPGLGLWIIADTWPKFVDLGIGGAQWEYARSATRSGALLAPAGVLVVGRDLYQALASRGLDEASTLLVVFGTRLATVGVSTALGVLFVVMHFRTLPASSETHFDDIADAYDVQIPDTRRRALLELKTSLMRDLLDRYGIGRCGLDVGCGQGAYVARMRELGFAVSGIDMSAGQIRLAAARVGDPDLVRVGSALDIPAADEHFDFLYTINVLHHLATVEDQRRAFRELLRVLKPGGVIFVHEINTRNALFRFYMGYVFPSLNCIDEGTERWLLPHRLLEYTDAPTVEVRYFTFLPEFAPRAVTAALRPLERALERSVLAPFSAHYMAVLRKPARDAM